jgi:hypothetical protein
VRAAEDAVSSVLLRAGPSDAQACTSALIIPMKKQDTDAVAPMLAALAIALAIWVIIGPPPREQPKTATSQLTSPL